MEGIRLCGDYRDASVGEMAACVLGVSFLRSNEPLQRNRR